MVHTCCCSACHQEERSGIYNFKLGLDDPYDELESWRGLDCCSWQGITCDLHTGHVVRMDLSGFGYQLFSARNSSSQNFHGLLPLQHLEYLDLSGVDFYSLSIPSELAMLNRLVHLSLADCGFTGRIPSDVHNMSSLKFLDVSGDDGLEGGGDRVVENIAASLTNLTTLDMSWCGVSGTTFSPLVNLTSLSHLYLSHNDFTHQPFPNRMSNLTFLVSLSFQDCGLQGPISSDLLGLPYLRNLYLNDNPDLKVNMSSIVQHSRKLEILDLGRTNVARVIPNSIGNMSSLTFLYLSDNNIEGVLPPTIGSLSRLEEFDLSKNSLRGNIPWKALCGLSKLSRLSLGSNQLNGSLPSTFGNLSSLVVLDLRNNSLSGILPSSLQKLSSLQMLHLEDNKFHGTFLLSLVENFTKITQLFLSGNNFLTVKVNGYWIPKFQLQALDLGSCNMEGDFPLFISTQYAIEHLDLSNNSLSGYIPDWLWDVTYLHNLEFLDLSMNLFDRFNPARIGKNGQHLRFLSLAKKNLHSDIPQSIYEAQLEVLDLSNNKLSGKIFTRFGNFLSTLKMLNLENNLFEGNIPSNFGNFKAMTNQTQSTEILPYNSNSNSSLPYIEKLVIKTKGQFLEYERSLALIRCLDLSNNNFAGDIPLEIGFLIGLRVLDLSRNQLSGKIPNSFEKLVQLESLDLARNNLIGAIPTELQFLTFLSYLDVSQNNLLGRIPQGGQLLTFNASYFSNNEHLCGVQINISCSTSHVSPKSSDDEDASEEEWEEYIWWGMGLGLSFGSGFAVVIGVLCLSKKSRSKCFKIMDDIIVIVDEIVRKKIFC
ncbi:hypothetical protein KI387_022907 [Taxus chinensis]|uniref:Leucine-rich repeat-containing N-terminal plant-type domain-containing protein n=1 Tax=Taxus chinensis TaxID=29808 RepID=A0AA38G1P7_TAXCH|nr:hypothetical protein KI387_022907 [Taxus chinensis]